MANIINAANAFAAGFSGGVSTYAQLDSLWAAQAERKRAEEDRVKLDKAMQDTAAYLEQSQDPTGGLSTPEGQQALGQLAMGNPEVAKAVNSNPGYSYAGVVKDPKQEDAYHIVVRGQNDEVRPVTVGREKGGTPVTYTGADLQSFSLTPFLDPKNDTPERRALMKLPQGGDVFDALATKFPGMTGAQLRAQAEAGAAKLSAGAIPTAKQGVAGVKATVRDGLRKDSQPGVIEEEEEEVVTPASEARIAEREAAFRNRQSLIQRVQGAPLSGTTPRPPASTPSGASSEFTPIEGQSFAEANLDRMGGKVAPKVGESAEDFQRRVEQEVSRSSAEAGKRIDKFAASEGERRDSVELAKAAVSKFLYGTKEEQDARNARNAEFRAMTGAQKAGKVGADLRDIGSKIKDNVFQPTVDNIRNNVVAPVSQFASDVADIGGAFVRGITGTADKAPSIPPNPATVPQTPQAAPQATRTLTPQQQSDDAAAAARSVKQTAPAVKQSVAQKVVASQRLPSKVMANPQHLAAVGQEIGSKIQSMPRGERVNADAEALDRLTKLGKGTKPNRAALYSAMYLVKSGVLTPAQLGQFASTGKLDNVEFDNAYKEISARQSYHQLDLNERQFAFSQFKEQMEQQRHVDNLNARYSLEAIRQNNALTKEQQKAEIKRVEGVQKNGREMLENAAYLRFKQANPQATEGEAKAGAIVLANQILGDEAGVYQMLGGRLPMFDRDYQKLLPVVEKMAPVKTQGGWSWTGYKDPVSLPLRGIDTDFSIGRLMATEPQGYQPKN